MEIKKKPIEDLEKSINDFKKHYFFRVNNSFTKIVAFSLIRGLASGLGWVIGATILVSILTYILSQIEFIPILGDWVSQLIEEINKFDRQKLTN